MPAVVSSMHVGQRESKNPREKKRKFKSDRHNREKKTSSKFNFSKK